MTNPILLFAGQPWVQRLGWTLVHFLWQGVLIVGLYAVLRTCLGAKRSPQARYVLSCAALWALTMAPIATFVLTGAPDSRATRSVTASADVSLTTGIAELVSPTPTANDFPIWREDVMPWLVMAWFAGAIVFWVRLTAGWVVAARMRSVLVRPAPPEWQRKLDELRAHIRVSRPVRLLVSALVQVPTVVGWLRPVVLVPVGALAGLPPGHVEALLAHELAHIRRHDYLVNILQNVAEALLFYHPAVWWISKHIRNERELCCDDVAVAISGDAFSYARALANLETCRPDRFNPVLAATGGLLPDRIRRLLGHPGRPTPAFRGPAAIASLVFLVIAAWSVSGQSPVRPSFEVASVKLNMETNGAIHLAPQLSSNRVTWRNVTLAQVAYYAWHITGPAYQVMGSLALPAGHNWYDIEAVAPGSPNDDDLRLMFQTLLEDRFKLKVHRETKELSGYDLTVAKNGPKLKATQPDNEMTINGKPDGKHIADGSNGILMAVDGNRLVGKGVSMAQIVIPLSRQLAAPVRDRTGLIGLFDYNVLFARDENSSEISLAPDLTTAIQEDLGLKLEKSRVQVEILVVDHVEKPSEN